MNKTGQGISLVAVLLIACIGIGIYLIIKLTPMGLAITNNFNLPAALGGSTGGDTIINEEGDVVTINQNNVDVCNIFQQNFPVWLAQRQLACGAAGGNFVCEEQSVGCYEIPVWDYTLACSSNEIRMIQFICSMVHGTFTCNAHQASCEV